MKGNNWNINTEHDTKIQFEVICWKDLKKASGEEMEGSWFEENKRWKVRNVKGIVYRQN